MTRLEKRLSSFTKINGMIKDFSLNKKVQSNQTKKDIDLKKNSLFKRLFSLTQK